MPPVRVFRYPVPRLGPRYPAFKNRCKARKRLYRVSGPGYLTPRTWNLGPTPNSCMKYHREA